MQNAREVLKREKAEAAEAHAKLRTTSGQLEKNLAESDEAHATLRSEHEQLQRSKEEFEGRLQASTVTLEEAEEEKKGLRARIADKTKIKNKLLDTIAATEKLKDQVNDLVRNESLHTSDVARLRSQLKQCTQDNAELHTLNATSARKLRDEQARARELQASTTESACRLRDEEDRVRELLRDVDRLRQQGRNSRLGWDQLPHPRRPSTHYGSGANRSAAAVRTNSSAVRSNATAFRSQDPRLAKRAFESEDSGPPAKRQQTHLSVR